MGPNNKGSSPQHLRGSNKNKNGDTPVRHTRAARKKAAFNARLAEPPVQSLLHDSPATITSSTEKKDEPIVTIMKITDIVPGINPHIEGWEEVLLYPVFFFLTAPVSFALMIGWIAWYMEWHTFSKIGWSSYLVYWTLLYFDVSPTQNAVIMPWTRGWFLTAVCRYFDATLILENHHDIHEARPTMTVQVPHSIIPMSTFCSAVFGPAVFKNPKDGTFRPAYCLVTSTMSWMLGYWHYLEAVGARVISRKAIRECNDAGAVVLIVTGGIAEMFLCHDKEERILIRRGFIREALKNGMDIVPAYHFNHTQTFRYLLPMKVMKPLATFSRKTGLPWCFYHGRFGSPFIPYKTKLTSVMGRAIRVEAPVSEPTEELVEKYVQEYKSELTRLYYTYRPEGHDRELVMLDKFPW